MDSSRAVQLSAVEQVHFDRKLLTAWGVRLSVVLFAMLNASSQHDWRPLVRLMVEEQLAWRLAHSADLHFVLQATPTPHAATQQAAQTALDDCGDLIRSTLAAAQPPLTPAQLEAVDVRATVDSAFEFPAIARVWELAQQSTSPKRHILLYYHTKVHLSSALSHSTAATSQHSFAPHMHCVTPHAVLRPLPSCLCSCRVAARCCHTSPCTALERLCGCCARTVPHLLLLPAVPLSFSCCLQAW